MAAWPRVRGTVQLRAPAGTFPVAAPCDQDVATITDLATKASGQDDLCDATVSDGGAELQLATPVGIGGGQLVAIAIVGLDNPAKPGPEDLSLSTSSNSGRTAGYRIVPGTSVAGTSLSVSNPAAGGGAVTYAVGFSASRTGALAASYGTVTLGGPPGTFLAPANCDQEEATVTDLTTKASASSNACSGSATSTCASFSVVVPLVVNAGDRVVLTVSGVKNPPDVGPEPFAGDLFRRGAGEAVFCHRARGPG